MMSEQVQAACAPALLEEKIRKAFAGKTVSKALSRQMKASVNVPSFVMEFLLGRYCSDPAQERQGLETVKKLISAHYLSPDERQKELSVLRQKGVHIIMDHVCVQLNLKKNAYEAELTSLGLKGIYVADSYPETYGRLLCGGLWCLVQLRYDTSCGKRELPVKIETLAPIQVPDIVLSDYREARSSFTREEWIRLLLRSAGLEPDQLTPRQQWLFLLRMVPLCESNYVLCELGPRSTGKSYLFKEISPYSFLVSGGQTTVANLFYNMSTKAIGLVALWDCVAFDEVAGIQLKEKDGVQIMKDYLAAGSFSRGREQVAGRASMVFVGNLDGTPTDEDALFAPFPAAMNTDTALLDRFHAYLPGWEIPKLYPRHFTTQAGLVTDYLAEILHALREVSYGDLIEQHFVLGDQLNQRDTIAVRKTFSGMVKLLHPDGKATREELEEILRFALEMRQRVKYQLYKLGGAEFGDYRLGYTVAE